MGSSVHCAVGVRNRGFSDLYLRTALSCENHSKFCCNHLHQLFSRLCSDGGGLGVEDSSDSSLASRISRLLPERGLDAGDYLAPDVHRLKTTTHGAGDLGTGKLDLKGAKQMAADMVAA